MLLDLAGKPISVGDIVLYTKAGAGRNLPPLEAGRVVRLTKASVVVEKLENDFVTLKTRKDGYSRKTGEIRTMGNWSYEVKEFVETGIVPLEHEAIRFYEDRFFVVNMP